MLNLRRKGFILILFLMLKAGFESQATGFGTERGAENENYEAKKLTKRGQLDHFGGTDDNFGSNGDNAYGPPIHITSGLLRFGDEGPSKESIPIYEGMLNQHLPIWNEISSTGPQIHAFGSVEHFPSTGVGHQDFGLPLAKPNYNDGGLHTQVISSNLEQGQHSAQVDDKVDLSNFIIGKGHYQIKSYG